MVCAKRSHAHTRYSDVACCPSFLPFTFHHHLYLSPSPFTHHYTTLGYRTMLNPSIAGQTANKTCITGIWAWLEIWGRIVTTNLKGFGRRTMTLGKISISNLEGFGWRTSNFWRHTQSFEKTCRRLMTLSRKRSKHNKIARCWCRRWKKVSILQ